MTYKEAIKRIVEHMTIHKMNEPRAIKISIALQMAIEAIEKQIPKQPVYIKEHNVIYFDWQCPCCKREYANTVHGIGHCVDCGQAIDWS